MKHFSIPYFLRSLFVILAGISSAHFFAHGPGSEFSNPELIKLGNSPKQHSGDPPPGLTQPFVSGVVSYTNGVAVQENFNNLGTSATAALPVGWRVSKTSAVQASPADYHSDVTKANVERQAGNQMPSNAPNGIYRFNANDQLNESAIGGLAGVNDSRSIFVYFALQNNGANATGQFNIRYDVEKYRNGSNPHGVDVQLFYSMDGVNWNSCGSLFKTNFPVDSNSNGSQPAPSLTVPVNASFILPGNVRVQPQEKVYFAWRYAVIDTPSGDAPAIGIDNINILPLARNLSVMYHGNGATSGIAPPDSNSPYVNGSTVTVLGNTGNLQRGAYKFSHWNTMQNGSGTSLFPGDTFTITSSTVLYAQWVNAPLLYFTGNIPTTYGSGCLNVEGAKKTYTIVNNGIVDATNITVTSNNSEFVVSNISSNVIAGNYGTISFDVTFFPTVLGSRTATLTVNSAEGISVSRNISGIGSEMLTPSVSIATTGSTNPSCGNSHISFVATAINVGAAEITYQWKRNGILVGHNSKYYTESYPKAGDIITCTITIADGCVTTTEVTSEGIVIMVNPRPLNPAKPTSVEQECGNAIVYRGAPPAGEVWYWQTFASGESKANSDESIVRTNSGEVYLRAFNLQTECWSESSSQVTVVVNKPIVITKQPVDVTVEEGNSAVFEVTTTGAVRTYQWQVLSTTSGADWTDIPGADLAKYAFDHTQLTQNGYRYRVRIMGPCGELISNGATLFVSPFAYQAGDVRPKTAGVSFSDNNAWEVTQDGITWQTEPMSLEQKKPVGRIIINQPDINAGSNTVHTYSSIHITEGGRLHVTQSSTTLSEFIAAGGQLEVKKGGKLILEGDIRLNFDAKLSVRSGGELIVNSPAINNLHAVWRGIEYFAEGSTFTIKNWKWDAHNAYRSILANNPAFSTNLNGFYFGNLIIDTEVLDDWILVLPGLSLINFKFLENNLEVINHSESKLINALHGTTSQLLIKGDVTARKGKFNLVGSTFAFTGQEVRVDIGGSLFVKGTQEVKFSHALNSENTRVSLYIGKDVVVEPTAHLTSDFWSTMIINGGTEAAPQYVEIANPLKNITLEVHSGSYGKLRKYDLKTLRTASVEIKSEGTLDFGFKEDGTPLHIIKEDQNYSHFRLTPGGSLVITSPQGITANGSVGNVQGHVGTFSPEAHYYYRGNQQQVTGDGLPATAKRVVIENTGADLDNTVQLSNTSLEVTEELKVKQGVFDMGNKVVQGSGVNSALELEIGTRLKIGGAQSFPKAFGSVILADDSVVEYNGDHQVIANATLMGYENLPPYSHLVISGTGNKTATGETQVNRMTTLNSPAVKLVVPATADYDPADSEVMPPAPNVFFAKKGIDNTAGTSGAFVLENNAMLIQDPDADNSKGVIEQHRIAKVKRFDYTYWGSPVNGQGLKAFSPGTLNERFYTYNEFDGSFSTIPGIDAQASFIPGKGYAIRAANNWNLGTPMPWDGKFVGTPNNGNGLFTFDLKYTNINPSEPENDSRLMKGLNLVSNPYPSNIDLAKLVSENSGVTDGVFYFWTNSNIWSYDETTPNGDQYGVYEGNNYAILNQLGGVPATGKAENGVLYPTTILKPGQGFMINSKPPGGSLVFNNSIRTTENAQENLPSVFFSARNAGQSSLDRFWLYQSAPSQNKNLLLVAYAPGSTNGYEAAFDAVTMPSSDSFYTILTDKKLAIQGRAHPLVTEDVVPVGSSNYMPGTYEIGIEKAEGIFAQGQSIYLVDQQESIVTNLSQGPYQFQANEGVDEQRFLIVYRPQSSLVTSQATNSPMEIYRDGADFVVKSLQKAIEKVEVYDTGGRLILTATGQEKELRFSSTKLVNGIYVVKAQLKRGDIVTRKIRK